MFEEQERLFSYVIDGICADVFALSNEEKFLMNHQIFGNLDNSLIENLGYMVNIRILFQ